eukprot:jgi/Tetstr1/421398/TSEL_001165.t1
MATSISPSCESGTGTTSNVPGASSRTLLLLLYAGGVYVSFIAHDYLQELIWHLPGYNFPQFMTLFEFVSCTVFPAAELAFKRTPLGGGNPLRFAALACLILPSMVAGTAALAYVSYPIKVVAKSTKLLPTMLIGSLLLGRRFNSWHYAAALCLCAGLVGFALSDAHASGSATTAFGLLLLGASLCFDAFIPNVQQRLLGNYKGASSRTSEAEVMMMTNLFGSLLLVPSSFFTGELQQALAFLAHTPQALPLLLMFSVTTFCGVAAYMRLVSNFSGVTAVVVTTSRKLVTIMLSFLFFPKAAGWGHLGSGAMLLCGVACNEVARRAEKKVKELDEHMPDCTEKSGDPGAAAGSHRSAR